MQRIREILKMSTSSTAMGLAVALLTTCSLCAGSPCHSDNWWDPAKNKCIPCTECGDQQIVFKPCQWERDTECKSLNDIQVDWLMLARTEPNWKERRKDPVEYFDSYDLDLDNLRPEDDYYYTMDWQTICLILAIISCVMFFIVAACVLVQHMRQWRRLERRLDRDVEELSAKLMARLAEVQHVENSTFLIENPIKDQKARPVEVQCVYLDQLLTGKEAGLPHRGNVYIEEASSKG